MLSAALAFATTSAASHWIIFFLNGRSALRGIALGGGRSIPTLADSLLFQHRPSFESGSALGASFPAQMLGVHLLCKELKPKQPENGNPRLKSQGLCPFGQRSNANIKSSRLIPHRQERGLDFAPRSAAVARGSARRRDLRNAF